MFLSFKEKEMIKLRFTVPVKFESFVYADKDDEDDDIINACIEMLDQADIVSYDEYDLEVDWDSIKPIEPWEVSE